jgi:hypothetical protein
MEHKNTLTNDLDDIEKLSDLKNRGVITEEEFIEKKKAILGSNRESPTHTPHAHNSEEIEKLIKKIKNAGSSSEAIGWLELIIIAGIFIAQFGFNVPFTFGFFGNTILLATSVLAIILGRRIKKVDDRGTKKYLVTLLITFIVSFVLVIADGGGVGILGIIIVIYLIQAVRAANKLEKLGVYAKEFEEKRHTVNKTGWIAYSIISFLLIVFGLFFDAQTYNTQAIVDSELTTANTTNVNNKSWQLFNSVEDSFRINFPSYPKKDVTPASKSDGITIQYTTYTSEESANDTYMVTVYSYDILSSNYNVKNGLEGMINGFVNNIDGGELTSSSFSSFGEYQAIDFVVNVPKNKLVFYGKAIVRNDLPTIKIYMILTGSTDGLTANYDKFANSFAFTN